MFICKYMCMGWSLCVDVYLSSGDLGGEMSDLLHLQEIVVHLQGCWDPNLVPMGEQYALKY